MKLTRTVWSCDKSHRVDWRLSRVLLQTRDCCDPLVWARD